MTNTGNQYGPTSVGSYASVIQGDIHGDIHQHFHESASGVNGSQQRMMVADWYSRTDFADQQTDQISRRKEGTGVWLLNHHEYQNWYEHANTTLFCPGLPGSGKSMMVASVVDDLQARFSGRTDVVIAYMYCNFNRQAEQDIHHMLAILVRQLFQEQTQLPEPVETLYRRHRDRATRPSEKELKDVLCLLVGLYARVFVVIDALDECQNADQGRDKLLAELFHLQQQKHGQVNFLATSRSLPEIKQRFPPVPTLRSVPTTTTWKCI